jgi:hypothetical protein
MKTIKDITNSAGQPSGAPSHVYDHALKKIYAVDSHKRLLFSRKNEPKGRWWSSWHDHLLDLSEAKQRADAN